eukprot:GEMP01020585.1.p1 GENE.GEMP01020585.1~~GEMP01020585.1.p1  ORF type:complete len:707 (-),score=162.86 GEMP01020585.1:465-2585(-)
MHFPYHQKNASYSFMLKAATLLTETLNVGKVVAKVAAKPVSDTANLAMKSTQHVTRAIIQSPTAEYLLGVHHKDAATNLDFVQHSAKEFISGVSNMSADQVGQDVVSGLNAVLKTVEAPVKLISYGEADYTRVRVIEKLKKIVHEDANAMEISPRDFIRFMRLSTGVSHQTQILQTFVDDMFNDGRLRSNPLIPRSFEKKLYVDVAKVMFYSIHRSLMQVTGTKLWGHELMVTESPRPSCANAALPQTKLQHESLEAAVDVLIDSTKPTLPRPVAKVLYTNVGMVIFQLLESVMSSERVAMEILGHKLVWTFEPLDKKDIFRQLSAKREKVEINEAAITEMVDELLDDAEINFLLVPDVIEAALYRHVFRMIIRICEEILSRLKINVFGMDVQLSIVNASMQCAVKHADIEQEPDKAPGSLYREADVRVSLTELQTQLKEVAEEHRALENLVNEISLKTGRPSKAPVHGAVSKLSQPESLDTHDFHQLAQQEKLARSLRMTEVINVDISVPYSMIGDFESYDKWMPLVTKGKIVSKGEVERIGPNRLRRHIKARVGFGINTKSFLGIIGDEVFYNAQLESPSTLEDGTVVARVYADAPAGGFKFGDRLVYDWTFRMRPTEEGQQPQTEVQLDLFFQAKHVLYLPLWDSLQSVIIADMMSSFERRAAVLQAERVRRQRDSALAVESGQACTVQIESASPDGPEFLTL